MKITTCWLQFAFLLALFAIAIPTVVSAQTDGTPSETKEPETQQVDAEDKEASATEEETVEEAADDAKTTVNEPAAKKASTKKAAAKKKTKRKKTHEVESRFFKKTVDLKGSLVAREFTEIALRPDSWSSFKIDEIVEHGTEVHEGDVLIKFDSQKINKSIESLELDLHLSELSIRKAEEEFPRLEKTLELNLAEAERMERIAREDFDRFKDLEKEFYKKMVGISVKGQEYNHSYLAEELRQLKKMYEADDLTEETEEIILTRSRNDLELSEFNVEDAKFYREGVLKVTLPRMEARHRNQVEAAKLALQRAQTAQQINLNRERYELEKMRQQRAASVEKHAKMLGDRQLMEIKAPSDGIVYFGQCVRGKWSNMSSMIGKLRPYGSVSANTVLMTIVQPRPLYVTALLNEADRPELEIDQAAEVVLPHDDSDPLVATVQSVSLAPVGTGKFWVELELAELSGHEWLVPGVSCKVEVITYEREDAIAVPEDAVHTDEDEDDLSYVWVVDPMDAKADAERRTVKTGKTNDDDIEILEGLAAGDVISLKDEKDKDDKADDEDDDEDSDE